MKNRIKVIFDAGPMVNGQKSGIGQYSYRLIDALARQYSDQLELVGHYFDFLGRKHPVLPDYPNITYKRSRLIPGKVLAALRRFGLQLPFDLLIKTRGDIAFFPNFVSLPVIQPAKKVVVVHDLAFEAHPEYLQPANLSFLKKFVPASVKTADAVVTISQNSKKEIIGAYHCSPKKISIVLPAVDHKHFKPQADSVVKRVKSKYGLDKPYILSLGTLEPRKNLIGVITAFELLPEELKQNYSLVLTGGKGWLDQATTQKIDDLSQAYSIIKTGYIDDADLPAIYSGASVFVFPAFYEGFGIPPLEAMACGTPVITSDNTSLPEVIGSAGIMIKAQDNAGLAKHIDEILSDKKLAATLSKQGIARASQFDWESSARELFKLFEDLAGPTGH